MSEEKRTRLDRRPEARSFTVERLLRHVRDGEIRIPGFQRPLRWRTSHVLDFFDSVYRGFPVGTLLFSKGKATAATVQLGAFRVDAPEMSDALFVVDGQQRVTALAAAILHPDERPRGGVHAIWFDLENERFRRLEVATPPPTWIPLNIAGNRRATLKWAAEWPLRTERPELIERAFDLNETLEKYEIPGYIVDRASEAALRTIFKRVNSSGVPMKESEVFQALYGGEVPRPIDAAIARIQSETAFGAIDAEWFLRCLKSVEGLAPRDKFRDLEENAVDAEAVRRTEISLLRTIEFLVEDAKIPHFRMLPYSLPLIVLARYFHLHPDPTARARRLLARWVWRGALSEAHSGSSDATVRDLTSRVVEDPFASIEGLLRTVPAAVPELARCRDVRWNGRFAFSRAVAVALFHRRPRDPATGDPVTREELQSLLDERELGEVAVDALNGSHGVIGGRVLLKDRDTLSLLKDAPAEVLASHLLDETAAAALRRGDADGFLQARSNLLDVWLGEFYGALTGMEESDRLPITEIVRRVDTMAAAS
ncbi:MAG: DUF262 domain-containing protein [Polyangiaceae bacterium]